jgi:hypothetical protein
VREVLTSIPKRKQESKEFKLFSRKLKGLVAIEFAFAVIATLVFVSSAIGTLSFRLQYSILAISPVYISFNLLEMLQSFIHGPFAPTPQDFSALHESDFAASPSDANTNQVFTSRMDIESSVPFEMRDFECVENYSSGMHESDLYDSNMGESDHRGRWFKGGIGKI